MGDGWEEERGGIGGGEGLGRGESEEFVRAPAAVGGGFVEVVKKRRGRPPRGQGKVVPTVKENDEEDVCFICFDGGSLVLCDRRGCPKAYHPACIKRDEAFFQSAARWNCGWHICSICQKSSHFMCYTCTFSLCKRCTKGADFLCVRGNKGFCNICFNMVKLIEKIEPGNKETVQVDFDDKTSWEYLFKVYWIYLKIKHCLTFDELTMAKRVDLSVSLSCKVRSSDDLYAIDRSYSDIDYLDEGQAIPNGKRRKTRRWSGALHKGATQSEEKVCAQVLTSLPNPTKRVSKELLEFVSHMKIGDATFLTPFDAQTLLLQYIKINGLRDPNCQSQIICDVRLRKLFGKARLGHIEMLKLVEYHFQSQEDSPAKIATPMKKYVTNGFNVDGFVNETSDKKLLGKDKCKGLSEHYKDSDRGAETNNDGYAAIDLHNINLIYLPLHLMENLLADDKFHEKAVGSVVRIKMSSGDQKQDLYRLVQVVGTIKVDESYRVRSKLTSWKLEIFNISKKEIISIDEISDQEFSEDECKRFRKSIKYGLATPLKVREIMEKAMALRTIKVANFLEREILRFSHLRDRASEKGQTKEFKDYVDKIELLNSPGEHQRLQNEVPEVHRDPDMDPGYLSEEDSRLSFHNGDSTVSNHPGIKRKGGNSAYTQVIANSIKKFDSGTNGATEMSTSYIRRKEALKSMLTEKQRSLYTEGISNGTIRETSLGAEGQSAKDFETEKIWHYQDPSWNIQGPFSILQLRKWNTSGYFPLDLRIWRTGEKQDESILLTDALDGQISKKPRSHTCEISIQSNASSDFIRSSCSSSLSTPADLVVNSRDGQCAESLRSHESLSSYSQLSSSPSTQTLAGKACEALSLLGQERWDGPKCVDKGPNEGVPLHQSSPVPNLNSEDIDSQRAEKNEINNVLSSYDENIKDAATDVKQYAPSIIPSVDSCRSSITDTVPSDHQLNPTFNLCSIPMEIPPTSTCQSATLLPVELAPVPLNPYQFANGGGKNEAGVSVNQTVVGPDASLPNAVSSWISGSCLVNASNEPTLMSNAWNSNPIAGSMPKPNEIAVDATATQPTTDDGAPSPFQFWHSIFGEDDEFPFADESVSDLLAEVDAMECLNAPASPTSAMVQAAQFSQTSKGDCFASTKGDAPSSTGNLQISCPPSVTDQQTG